MPVIEKVDLSNKKQVNDFVKFPFRLYKDCPHWVPPFIGDIKLMLNPQKHPFYAHSDAEFFVVKDGKDVVGRIAMLENKSFNDYHVTQKASFYLFDCVEDISVAKALFDTGFEWSKSRGLTDLVGPKGFSPFDGYGILVQGFEYPQMMTMMNYNYPYYPKFFEECGFEKVVDFVSCYLDMKTFHLPEKIHEVARRIKEKDKFQVKRFANKKELVAWAGRIGEAYNKTFINNWEYYPLTPEEVKFQLDNIMVVAVPNLIKIITYEDEIVGFLLGFPDITPQLQRNGGRITPWGILDMFNGLKKSKFISLNGVGVLSQFHGRGANALLYTEMLDTILNSGYTEAELTQVAESAIQMRKDLITVGGKEYKNHRIYHHLV
jgi:hypothetical protein